jgi:hypothetical protein
MHIFVSCFLLVGMLFSTAIIADPWTEGHFRHRDKVSTPVVAERIYFDSDDVPMDQDGFHIRIGANEWLKSDTIHRDVTGFFTFENDVMRSGDSLAYEKHWQCPYCHLFWPENSPCQNPKCPSRYR